MPYITPDALIAADYGARAQQIPGPMLEAICEDASNDIDAYKATYFGFKWWGGPNPGDPPAERIPFDGHTLKVWPAYTPIRQVVSYRIVLAFFDHTEFGPYIDGGAVTIDRDEYVEGVAFYLALQFLPVLVTNVTPYVELVYSSGYDAGIDPTTELPSAPDGLVLPYPSWLVTAARYQAQELCHEYWNGRRGLGTTLQSISGGGFSYHRPVRRAALRTEGAELTLNPRAKAILDGHFEQVYVSSPGDY